MLIEKSKESIILKNLKNFPARKIYKRPVTSCKSITNPRTALISSLQKNQIITSSNFVVRKHKPIANPFNEFSFSSQKRIKANEMSKTKIRSLNSLRNRINYFSNKKVLLLSTTTSKLETKRLDEDTIRGWD